MPRTVMSKSEYADLLTRTRAAWKATGMSATTFAELCNLHPQNVVNVLSSTTSHHPSLLKRIAALLKVS